MIEGNMFLEKGCYFEKELLFKKAFKCFWESRFMWWFISTSRDLFSMWVVEEAIEVPKKYLSVWVHCYQSETVCVYREAIQKFCDIYWRKYG